MRFACGLLALAATGCVGPGAEVPEEDRITIVVTGPRERTLEEQWMYEVLFGWGVEPLLAHSDPRWSEVVEVRGPEPVGSGGAHAVPASAGTDRAAPTAAPPRTTSWLHAGFSGEGRSLGVLEFCGVATEHTPNHTIESQGGRQRVISTRHLDDGLPTTLVLATIHGDEYAGTPLVQMLATALADDPTWTQDRRIVLVPVANPDGLVRNTRGNANGVDLNRNFDAANWGTSKRAAGGVEPLSEPESRALVEIFERCVPDRVVSLHQPFGLVDFDGPGEAYARAVAEAGGLPVQKLGSRPGSFGSYVGVDHGIPTLTIELPAGAHRWSDARLWERFGPMLIEAVTWSPSGVESDAGSDASSDASSNASGNASGDEADPATGEAPAEDAAD